MQFEHLRTQPFKKHFENHIAETASPEPHDDTQEIPFAYSTEEEMVDKEFFPTHELSRQESLQKNLATGRYMDIVEFLESGHVKEDYFQKEVRRIRQTPELESTAFLTEKDWEILTVIELKDRKTFEHSVGTYLILKEKIEKRIPKLVEWIEQEDIKIEQLYRASLLHDVGKLAIHDLILKSKTNEDEWSALFTTMLGEEQNAALAGNNISIPDRIRNNPQEIVSFFSEHGIRASRFVPFEKILKKEQIDELKSIGINPSLPLGEIMKIHEQRSGEILRDFGFVEEAELAENHHNYKKIPVIENKYPASRTSLHISRKFAKQMIHLADVQQAMQSDRHYHTKKSRLEILASLVDHAKNGLIEPFFTAIWINDEIENMDHEYLREIRFSCTDQERDEHTEKRRRELALIDVFLDEYREFIADFLDEYHSSHDSEQERYELVA